MNDTIVVIEDEATIASSVAARLTKEGFRVEVALTGPDGVDACRRHDPDLVILDLMLPGLDGLEVCRLIQEDHPVPVIEVDGAEVSELVPDAEALRAILLHTSPDER